MRRARPHLKKCEEILTRCAVNACTSPVHQQRTSELSGSTVQMVNIPRGPRKWCERNLPGSSPQAPRYISIHSSASPSTLKAEHRKPRLTGANSIQLQDKGSAGAKSDRLARPSDECAPPPSSPIQLPSPPQTSSPLRNLDHGVDLERFRKRREMTACIKAAKTRIRDLEAHNMQLQRQQKQTGKEREAQVTMEELQAMKDTLRKEWKEEMLQLICGHLRQDDWRWQGAEERDGALQMSGANAEPIGGRTLVPPNPASREDTAEVQVPGPKSETYGNDGHVLDARTGRFQEPERFEFDEDRSQEARMAGRTVDPKKPKGVQKERGNRCDWDAAENTEPSDSLGHFSDRHGECLNDPHLRDTSSIVELEEQERLPLQSIDQNQQHSPVVVGERRKKREKISKNPTESADAGKGKKRALTSDDAEDAEDADVRERKRKKKSKRVRKLIPDEDADGSERKRMKKSKKDRRTTESADTGKVKKRALTPDEDANEHERKRKKRSKEDRKLTPDEDADGSERKQKKQFKKDRKMAKRRDKSPASNIASFGSSEHSSPILSSRSTPVQEVEVEDSQGKAAKKKAKGRHRAETEEGSIDLSILAKKTSRTRNTTMSSQPDGRGEEIECELGRSMTLRRYPILGSEIPDTPEKAVGAGAKRKQHSETEVEVSICEARDSNRSKKDNEAIMTSTPETNKQKETLTKTGAAIAPSSRSEAVPGVANTHDREGRNTQGKLKKPKERRQTVEEKDENARKAMAMMEERRRTKQANNANSTDAPSQPAAARSSKAKPTHGETKPGPASEQTAVPSSKAKPTNNETKKPATARLPRVAIIVPPAPRPPNVTQPPAQPRPPQKSLTPPIPTRPTFPAPAPMPPTARHARSTLSAHVAHDRATNPAPLRYRSDIHPAGGLPAAMRRAARSTNIPAAFPIIADCTCGGSVPTFFSPYQEPPDLKRWAGSTWEFWHWVRTIVECKGHDLLAKGRCEVWWWVWGPGKVCVGAGGGLMCCGRVLLCRVGCVALC